MGGTPAQTRSERVLEKPNEPPLSEGHTSGSRKGRMEHQFEMTANVPIIPHDSPLLGGYTPGSDEGRLKLQELLTMCTKLSKQAKEDPFHWDFTVAVTPINRNRKVRVSSSTEASGSKPRSNTKKDRISQTSICNANVKHLVFNVNSELICATCHECMFDAIHDLCVSDYLSDVNARVKSKSVKSRSAKSKKKKT
ncbi:hypothetical protein Tco_1072273 [Tanacetum coccineum]